MTRIHNASPLGANEHQVEIGNEPAFEAFDTITTPEQEKRTREAGAATQEFTTEDELPNRGLSRYENFFAPDYPTKPKTGGN